MKTRQEIINSYQKGDLYERLDIFLMYRHLRNEFMAIDHQNQTHTGKISRRRILQPAPDKLPTGTHCPKG